MERRERPLEKALAHTAFCPLRALGEREKARAVPGAERSSFGMA